MAQIIHQALHHTYDVESTITPIVLVVDDNYASRIVAKALLEREGYGVVLAEDGEMAVKITRVQTFDLILMDIQMPIMDGLAAAQAILGSDNPNHATTIIAITAYADGDLQASCRAIGMADMLIKPFRLAQIKSVWQRAEPNRFIFNTSPMLPSPIKIRHTHQEKTLQHQVFLPEKFTKEDTAPNMTILDTDIIAPLIAAAPIRILLNLYAKFYTSADAYLYEILSHIGFAREGNQSSIELIRRNAHALKGACANVGFHRASRLAALLQNATAEDITPLVEKLGPAIVQSRFALTAYLEQALEKAG